MYSYPGNCQVNTDERRLCCTCLYGCNLLQGCILLLQDGWKQGNYPMEFFFLQIRLFLSGKNQSHLGWSCDLGLRAILPWLFSWFFFSGCPCCFMRR